MASDLDQPGLFGTPPKPPKPPRAKVLHRAHVIDAGEPGCRFGCPRCGWESDWIPTWSREHDGGDRPPGHLTLTEAKRGAPCALCNATDPEVRAELEAEIAERLERRTTSPGWLNLAAERERPPWP